MLKEVAGAILLILTSGYVKLESSTRTCLQGDFEDQVGRLIQNVSASEERLNSLSQLLHSVEDTLNTVWPGTKVNMFGSLSTGLGSDGSDADVAVTLPPGCDHRAVRDVLRRARLAFESSPHTYQQIRLRNRLPSITLFFVPARISCDINFRPQATAFESDLLRYLLSADERALKLALLIKHWAKLHNLIAKKYLTSYGMMMLVVFFLQQRSILPSVVELQENVEARILNSTDRYNVAFGRRRILTENNERLYQIVGEFFEYYKDFDFDKFIVCPFTGQPVERRLFEDVSLVPDDFHLYKNNVASNITRPFNITAVCIQSLLVLSDNCAWRVDTTDRFKTHFGNAAKLYKETDECSFLSAILQEDSTYCNV